MFNLFKKMACWVALLVPLSAYAVDVPSTDASQKVKLEFVRSSGTMSVLAARVDVNGQRVGEIGKGETAVKLIDPGRTLVKVDSAYLPGQVTFSFTAENGAEYKFEINDSTDTVTAERLFGTPPKVANGVVIESGGVLKATLLSVNLPKPVEPVPPPAIKPVKAEPVPDPSPAPATVVKSSLSIEDQLKALKHLYEQELISKETYLDKQQKILDGLK